VIYYWCPGCNCLYVVGRCQDEKCLCHGCFLDPKNVLEYVKENTHEKA
jgi:hypothetical protein